MRKTKSGFTIVELLIVIVIITILAAITVVTYNGIQNRTNDSTVQSDLSKLVRYAGLYKNDMAASYPTGSTNTELGTALSSMQMKLSTSSYAKSRPSGVSASNIAWYDVGTGADYAVFARSKSMKLYYISSSSNGVREYTANSTFVTNWPGVNNTNLINSIGMDGTNFNVVYYVYSDSSETFRIWN